MDSDGHGTTTVAFELAALQALARPGDAFSQTRSWASAVGILSDRPAFVITKFARDHRIDYAFHSAHHDLVDSLVTTRLQPEHAADRFLLIGTEAIDEAAVAERGWSFLSLESAAEAAHWPLGEPRAPASDNQPDGWP